MKIKRSFVTNSSSTSFVGFGICTYRDREIMDKLKEIAKSKDPDFIIDEDYEDYYEIAEAAIDKDSILGYAFPEDSIILGVEFTSMPMDMTRREFQDKISEELKKIGIDCIPSIIDETWYN